MTVGVERVNAFRGAGISVVRSFMWCGECQQRRVHWRVVERECCFMWVHVSEE